MKSTRRLIPAVLPLLSLLTLGCGDATSLLVEVSSPDLLVPADIDELRFEARSASGAVLDATYPIDTTWPHTLSILPKDSSSETVLLTVSGLRAGARRITRVLPTEFSPGVTRRISVVLTRDCLDVVCDDGVGCIAGLCSNNPPVDAGVDSGARLDGGVDAAPPDDDAGDGGDAGRDSGFDSGVRDSGSVDTGVDAGSGPIRCIGGATPDVCRGILVLSELAPHGASASDEFVELHNSGAEPIDASGVIISYAARDVSSPSPRATLPPGTIIASGGFYLAASAGYTRGTTPDLPAAWATAQGFASRRGSVVLTAGAVALDIAGWMRVGEESPMSEGAPILGISDGAFASGSTFERKATVGSTAITMSAGGADETAGNGFDSGDNLTDFVIRASDDPQNASSTPEP